MRIVRLILSVGFVAAVCAGAFLYRELHNPITHSHAGEYIEISRGSTPSEIIAKLESSGVLHRSWTLLTYMKVTGATIRLKAGEYRFRSPITALEVLKKLQEGERRLSKFTVKEGWTRWDIAAALVKNPDFKLRSEDDALALMDDVSLIRLIDPTAENLEGYLFPDTYSYSSDTSAAEMVAMMTKHFLQEWNSDRATKASKLGLSPRQAITVASLIETEAKLDEDRPLISSVIFNRLDKNIPLGIDSAVIYASKLAGKWRNDGKVYKSDVDRRSPYNTRLVIGLPPGPIGSPGISSIEAALNPPATDYLYYVRNPDRDDGAHNFYATGAEFERGVQALRKWESEHNRRNSHAK